MGQLFDLDKLLDVLRTAAGSNREASQPKVFNLMAIADESPTASKRFFNELETYTEAPAWIPYLPKPGNYIHDEYGMVQVSPERNANFVQNYKNGVYQKYLPIDLEHDLPNSGAVGHIEDFRLNEDGSVHANVDWNDRGKAVITGDRFRYFSPAWKDVWTDSVDGKQYQDVAVGGALTTRPFFKDKSLGPIISKVAGELYFSETTSFKEGDTITFLPFEAKEFVPYSKKKDDEEEEEIPAESEETKKKKGVKMGEEINPTTGTPETKVTAENPATASTVTGTITMSEEVARIFAAQDAKIAALTEANKLYAESVQALQYNAQEKRFTDIVTGKGGASDGLRWFGEPGKHVKVLTDLAKAYGEDSDTVKAYIENNRAIAQQANMGGLFSEAGRSAPNDTASALGEVDTLAAKLMNEHPDMSKEKAVQRILSTNKRLYDRYMSERPQRNSDN